MASLQPTLIKKYGHDLTQIEIEAVDNVLKHGRGLALKSKKQASDYPNLINNQLVYCDGWGNSPSLKATLKGDGFFNDKKQQ